MAIEGYRIIMVLTAGRCWAIRFARSFCSDVWMTMSPPFIDRIMIAFAFVVSVFNSKYSKPVCVCDRSLLIRFFVLASDFGP